MGWNETPPDVHPQARPVDGGEEQRRHEQHAGQQQQEVAVALQVPGVADHQEGEHVEGHAERDPERLVPCLAVVRGPGSQRAMTT